MTSTSKRRARIFAILALILIVAASLFFRVAPEFADVIADTIYKNVAEPADAEMPVTVTSYPSGSHVVAMLGGKGQGLNCSLPPVTEYFFRSPDPNNPKKLPVSQRFRQACVFHDLCYRHGLATYGYSQAECDYLLQEQAFRICRYGVTPKEFKACQIDAKKVLLGVQLGGFGSFQSWGKSTYFEFDSKPYQSEKMAAGRVLKNPFSGDREAEHVILNFQIKRSGVLVRCHGCADRNLNDLERKAAGIVDPPSSSEEHKEQFNPANERFVWLPPLANVSAPHVVGRGSNESIVWLNRERDEDSQSCIAAVDPRVLLTHTRPSGRGCNRGANGNKRVKPARVDLLVASPQPAIVLNEDKSPNYQIVATGLTNQLGGVHFCRSKDLMHDPEPSDQRSCRRVEIAHPHFHNSTGVFQNFPIVRGSRHIYLARTYFEKSSGNLASGILPLILDLPEYSTGESPPAVPLVKPQFLEEIDEAFDPLFPVAHASEDLRVIGALSSGAQAKFVEIDLNVVPGKPKYPAVVDQKQKEMVLHSSWLRRPAAIVEFERNSNHPALTQLVLSRSQVCAEANCSGNVKAPRPAKPMPDQIKETTLFEFLVAQREVSAGAGTSFVVSRAAKCTIVHTVSAPNAARPCQRIQVAENEGSATVGTMMQGAQLLTGRFVRSTEFPDFDLALMNACTSGAPIVFRASPSSGGRAGSFLAPSDPPAASTTRGTSHQVSCSPIDDISGTAAAPLRP